jgi:hypothetical protein
MTWPPPTSLHAHAARFVGGPLHGRVLSLPGERAEVQINRHVHIYRLVRLGNELVFSLWDIERVSP